MEIPVAVALAVIALSAVSAINPYGIYPPAYYNGTEAGEPLHLTPLIQAGNIGTARTLSLVNLTGAGDVVSYSGYFTVNAEHQSNLFFWFFPSRGNWEEDPLIVWLQGGPGSSSMLALFWENGPFEVNDEGELVHREVSWDLDHSVIYIDSPAGTGFSYTESENGYVTDQTQVGEQLYVGLIQFLQLFPELQENPFYVTGESYGGKYVPALGYTIYQYNPTAELKINLQGLAIGNGLSDPINQFQYSNYLRQIGLVDFNTQLEMEEYETQAIEAIRNEEWADAASAWSNTLGTYQRASGFSNNYNFLFSDSYNYTNVVNYLNTPEVRAGIHVGNITFQISSGTVYSYLREDIPKSVAPWVAELLTTYRILIYNGQLDIICAYAMEVNYLESLEFDAAAAYSTAERRIWYYGDDIAGYVKTAGNLTEVLVRNAGHLVPTDQPEWAHDLLTQFTRNTL